MVAPTDATAENSSDSLPSSIPPYKPRLYKCQIETSKNEWMDLAFFVAARCHEIYDTADATASLAQVVQAMVSYLRDNHLATTPLFEDMTCAQFDALLAHDAAVYAAVRHLVTRSRLCGWDTYSTALRVAVNHLCQKPKVGPNARQRVQFAPDDAEGIP